MSVRASSAEGIRQLYDCAHEVGVFDDRRAFQRRRCSICIAAFPIDDTGRIVGSIMVGHCIDVLETGLRVAFPHPTNAEYLRVEPLQDGSLDAFAPLAMKVLRHDIEGQWYAYAGSVMALPETG